MTEGAPSKRKLGKTLSKVCIYNNYSCTCISSVYITFNSAHGLNKPLISSINLRNSNFLLVDNKTRQKKCIYFEGGT